MLAPRVELALPLEVLLCLPPAGDGRVPGAGRVRRAPPLEHHRLAGGEVVEPSGDRHAAAGLADVLAERGQVGVGREQLHGEGAAPSQLDLGQDGIGLEVEPRGHGQVLVAQDGGAREVDEEVGAGEHLAEP